MDTLPGELLRADIVFWDPYSPKTAPHLWNATTFARLRKVCREGCTVHTYSAATPTRSAMLLAGFFVGTGESTGTKGETTTAAVCGEDLAHPLGAEWLSRLSRSTSPLPSDIGSDPASRHDALERIRALPQFTRPM